MNDYIITQDTKQDYNGFLLCLTTKSFFEYFHNIENESLLKNSKGILLIDQLLVTGNEENRYISCVYNCGQLILNSAKYVIPDNYYRKLAINILKNNMYIVENSILTSYQKKCILNGTVF